LIEQARIALPVRVSPKKAASAATIASDPPTIQIN
jgi:hypothetical protein